MKTRNLILICINLYLAGLTFVSQYGTSVAVVIDKNKQQTVFATGGFNREEMPCMIIEKIFTVV